VADASSTSRGHNRDASARKRRWRTPRPLFTALDAIYGFGLDAAAEHGAQLCAAYIPPAMDTLRTPWVSICERNADGERVAFFNPPWGPRGDDFPGTGAFTARAIEQARTLEGVVLLLPTAPDTRWWRALFAEAVTVRLLPRVAFIDPDTGTPAEAPPGAGCTVFTLWPGERGRHVLLCDELGRTESGGVR
jgi:phage N-6-adenine-methyltransferase